jgi:acyl-coenzyme A synthetase/AMP-(fatty) acid ligase
MVSKAAAIESLMHHVVVRPDKTAFMYKGEPWTYERLGDLVEKLARGLTKIGVRSGDRVALHFHNGPELIAAYYACFRLEAIASPLRTAFKFVELDSLLRRLKPTVYLGDARLYENIAELDEEVVPQDRRFLVNGTNVAGIRSWSDLLETTGALKPIGRSNKDVPAVLINTSGTSAQPKLVTHSRETLAHSIAMIIDNWDVRANDVMVMHLPMAHVGGLMSVISYMHSAVPFVLLETFDADELLDSIERYRCTWCIGFPAQYAALLERQRSRPRDLSSLRICITAADMCPLELQSQVTSEFNAPLYNLWGATEVVGSLTFGLRSGPVSRISKGAQIRLVDENGSDVTGHEAGELLVRGSNVFLGYWNDAGATETSLKDGWYHTGDIMRRGEMDELWYVSRKKDIIIIGGTNVSPLEVEGALVASHPEIAEAAVVGIPDSILGQRVFGFVTLVNGAKESICSEILRNVAQKLASYKVPVRLKVLHEMPRNALSKVDRSLLKALAAKVARQVPLHISEASSRSATSNDR